MPGAVNLPLPQPLQQIDRLQIHQLHLVGGVEYAVRDALGNGHTGDGGHLVVEALQMLYIDGGIDVNACTQQLLHVLIAFYMAAALGVGMGKLVHQDQLGMALQRRVQIEFTQLHSFVWNDLGG